MNEPQILILNALILSMGNSVLWWLLFDDEFEERLHRYQDSLKAQVVNENQEFMDQMQSIIELDPKAAEVIGLDDKWQDKIKIVEKLRRESDILRTRIVWVYYVSILSIILAGLGIPISGGIQITQTFTLYITALSWWGIIIGVLLLLAFLTQYQLIHHKTTPITEGEAIRSDSPLAQIFSALRNIQKT